MAAITLQGESCLLRALEPDDLDFLYRLENSPIIWEISNTLKPYSKAVLNAYLENAHKDIYDIRQLRLCICDTSGKRLGLIDYFDFDPKHRRAGVGIIIMDPNDRSKGFGAEALQMFLNYGFGILGLHQVYANILEGNWASRRLFEKMGFELVGVKKDWILWNGSYKNELLYQKLES